MKLALSIFAALAAVAAGTAAEPLTFNDDIRPILSDNCFACHGTDPKHRKADLRLDTEEGALRDLGGYSALVPGDVAKSEAWLRIVSKDEDEMMPPAKSHKPPLTAEQRALIKRWIEEGAKYQKHWAFERVPPAAEGSGIDPLVKARLEKAKLTFSPEADKGTLLRRATLDMTGLPPTLAELDAFEKDTAPEAFEKAVARLLASPHFGEQMARPWLDAVRYGDTHGMHFDNIRSVWPYRDWVVRAFNENLPFDQFTVEQIAGDLLRNEGGKTGPTQSQLVASGYNRLNLTSHEGGSITEELLARYTADRTETTAGVWLGLTANCASCHDHKFDPLAQKEYYQLGAFFRGLADREWDGNLPLPGPHVLLANPAQQVRLDAIAAELPAREVALAQHSEAGAAATPLPSFVKKPTTYEVVWAEDGDLPTPENLNAPPQPGEWRTGKNVPLVGGERALRMEGKSEHIVEFDFGDVPLVVPSALRAFAHLNLDPAKAPRAVSIEFLSPDKYDYAKDPEHPRRFIWGDPKAFGSDAKDAIVVAALPLPGTYVRLEADAQLVGLTEGYRYSGIRIAISDGAVWWDRLGTICTSIPANDPLLSLDSWRSIVRDKVGLAKVALTHDSKFLLQVQSGDPTPEEKEQMQTFYRNHIFGPARGVLEKEAHAARRLMAEQVTLERAIPGSLVSRELPQPRPSFVLLRGQYSNHGDAVEPATPAFLPALKHDAPRASRLDLARWIVARENPLTARVTVNRIWQQFFGAGFVRTPGDFGAQGDPPTHPALLDWLAGDFMDHGWDVKRLVQQIVTSKTYRQTSLITPALLERDPANRLFARGPRFRLDGEVLRDQALALSGLLVPEIGGAPVRPYQPDNVWEPVAFSGSNTKKYAQDSGPALYRRSLYTFWKRTAPPVSLATFDAPARESFCIRRDRSDTPLQALALLNDVQQFEAARAFAERLLTLEGDDAARLAQGFRSVTAREPNDAERRLLAAALATQRARFSNDAAAAKQVLANGESKPTHDFPPQDFAAWTLVANLLLNLDETITRN